MEVCVNYVDYPTVYSVSEPFLGFVATFSNFHFNVPSASVTM